MDKNKNDLGKAINDFITKTRESIFNTRQELLSYAQENNFPAVFSLEIIVKAFADTIFETIEAYIKTLKATHLYNDKVDNLINEIRSDVVFIVENGIKELAEKKLNKKGGE